MQCWPIATWERLLMLLMMFFAGWFSIQRQTSHKLALWRALITSSWQLAHCWVLLWLSVSVVKHVRWSLIATDAGGRRRFESEYSSDRRRCSDKRRRLPRLECSLFPNLKPGYWPAFPLSSVSESREELKTTPLLPPLLPLQDNKAGDIIINGYLMLSIEWEKERERERKCC